MRRLSIMIMALMLSLSLACGAFEGTPPPNRDFVGSWAAKDGSARLAITAEGHVDYAQQKGGTNTSINAPAQQWSDSSFTVGALGLSTDFTIEQAPTLVDGVWHMSVDGIEYTRPGN